MPVRAYVDEEEYDAWAMIPSVRGRIDARGSVPTTRWDPNTGTLRLDWEDVPEAWLEIKVPLAVQQPAKRFKSDKSSVEVPRSTQAGETSVGTVQIDDNGVSFVETPDGETLFFENEISHNRHRGIGSDVHSNARDENGDTLYFRLDSNDKGMSDTSCSVQLVGKAFPKGTRVTYTRRLPSQLQRLDGGDPNAVAMYHVSNRPRTSELKLPDGFDGFAFRVKAV